MDLPTAEKEQSAAFIVSTVFLFLPQEAVRNEQEECGDGC